MYKQDGYVMYKYTNTDNRIQNTSMQKTPNFKTTRLRGQLYKSLKLGCKGLKDKI